MLLVGPEQHTRWPAKGFCVIRKTRRGVACSPPRRARYPRPRPRRPWRSKGGPEEAPHGTKSMVEHSHALLSSWGHPNGHLGTLGVQSDQSGLHLDRQGHGGGRRVVGVLRLEKAGSACAGTTFSSMRTAIHKRSSQLVAQEKRAPSCRGDER